MIFKIAALFLLSVIIYLLFNINSHLFDIKRDLHSLDFRDQHRHLKE